MPFDCSCFTPAKDNLGAVYFDDNSFTSYNNIS